jgi:hypothetical protein
MGAMAKRLGGQASKWQGGQFSINFLPIIPLGGMLSKTLGDSLQGKSVVCKQKQTILVFCKEVVSIYLTFCKAFVTLIYISQIHKSPTSS